MNSNPAFQDDERFQTPRDWDAAVLGETKGYGRFLGKSGFLSRKVITAVGLLVFGTFFVTMGATRMLGLVPVMQPGQATGMLVVGSLTFIPGAYYSYIAYAAFVGRAGYSLDSIPLVE